MYDHYGISVDTVESWPPCLDDTLSLLYSIFCLNTFLLSPLLDLVIDAQFLTWDETRNYPQVILDE